MGSSTIVRSLRHAVADFKYKKKRNAEDESDLDQDAAAEHGERCKARKIEKPEKKIAKDNEKLVEEGKPAQDKNSVRWRLTARLGLWGSRRSTGRDRPRPSTTSCLRNSSRRSTGWRRRSGHSSSSCRWWIGAWEGGALGPTVSDWTLGKSPVCVNVLAFV